MADKQTWSRKTVIVLAVVAVLAAGWFTYPDSSRSKLWEYHNFGIYHMGDSVFTHQVTYAFGEECHRINWFGHEHHSQSISDGFYYAKPADLTDYDPSIVSFTDRTIIPLRPGRTTVFVRQDGAIVDSVLLEVRESVIGLVVEEVDTDG